MMALCVYQWCHFYVWPFCVFVTQPYVWSVESILWLLESILNIVQWGIVVICSIVRPSCIELSNCKDLSQIILWKHKIVQIYCKKWLQWTTLFNSCPPSTANIPQWIWSALVQIMACHLIGTMPLSEPVLGYFAIWQFCLVWEMS